MPSGWQLYEVTLSLIYDDTDEGSSICRPSAPKNENIDAHFGPAKYLRQQEAGNDDGLFSGPTKDLLQPEVA